MKHHRETEIKLQVHDPAKVRRRVSKLGFKISVARHFESNRVFDFPDLRLRKSRSLLRLRFARGGAVLTFKGPPLRSRAYKTRREIEAGVENGLLLLEILKSLGLKQVFLYEKYRTIYRQDGKAATRGSPLLVYDETPVGNYIELEGPEEWIDSVATQLGYSRSDYVTCSYLALYMRKCRDEGRKPGDMVFGRFRGKKRKL